MTGGLRSMIGMLASVFFSRIRTRSPKNMTVHSGSAVIRAMNACDHGVPSFAFQMIAFRL
jgi:hypothetical protein